MDSHFTAQKVKHYRIRSGVSQMDLELEIEASPGTISRIEHGKVNPTKETLLKISQALNLCPEETASLFGIEFVIAEPILTSPDEVQETSPDIFFDYQNLDTTLEQVSSQIKELGFKALSIYIVNKPNENFRLKKAVVPEISLDLATQILDQPIFDFLYSYQDNTLITKVLKTGKNQTSDKIFELLVPNEGNYYAIQRNEELRLMVGIPIKLGDNTIGCLIVASEEQNITDEVLEKLKLLTDRIAVSICVGEFEKRLEQSMEVSNNVIVPLKGIASEFTHAIKLISMSIKEVFVKSSFTTKITIFTFIFLTGFWIFNQLFVEPGSLIYTLWADIYFIFPLMGGLTGIWSFVNNIKSNHVILATSVGLLLNVFGQIYYTIHGFYNYPNLGELGFLGGSVAFLIGSIFINKLSVSNNQNVDKKFLRLFFIFLSLIFIGIEINKNLAVHSYQLLNRVLIVELTFTIVESLTFLILFKVFLFERKNKFITLQFIAFLCIRWGNSLFSNQINSNEYVTGNLVDFLYFLGYFALYLSIAVFPQSILLKLRNSISANNLTHIKDYCFSFFNSMSCYFNRVRT